MMARRANWEHFEHRADVGVRGHGPNRAAAFESAAVALTAVVTDPALVEPRERIEIECTAPDIELLLADWLNAIVYEMATRRMLFSRFSVVIDDTSLRGEAWGEAVDVKRHQPAAEVKGATYTELSVRQEADGTWTAQCVLDV